ncbi:unnamed protein product, partial [Mesorhabditis spiculigera]
MLLSSVFVIETLLMILVSIVQFFLLLMSLFSKNFYDAKSVHILVICILASQLMLIPNTLILNVCAFQFQLNDEPMFKTYREFVMSLKWAPITSFQCICFGLCCLISLGMLNLTLRAFAIVTKRTEIQHLSRPYLAYLPLTFGPPLAFFFSYGIVVFNQAALLENGLQVARGTLVFLAAALCYHLLVSFIGGIILVKRTEPVREIIIYLTRAVIVSGIFGGIMGMFAYLFRLQPDTQKFWNYAPIFCLFVSSFSALIPVLCYIFGNPIRRLNEVEAPMTNVFVTRKR